MGLYSSIRDFPENRLLPIHETEHWLSPCEEESRGLPRQVYFRDLFERELQRPTLGDICVTLLALP